MSRSPVELVREFCAEWSFLDVERIMPYFTDDAVYHNMPGPPVSGKPAVRAAIERFLKGWERTEWEVLNIGSQGHIVFAERIDHIWAGERHIDLPVIGVFELDGDHIRAWRDYFDLATYTRAMNPSG